jgi:hypothetical protein
VFDFPSWTYFVHLPGFKEIVRDGETECLEFFNEPRSDAICAKSPLRRSTNGNTGLLEKENFLQRNRIAFHSSDLLKTDYFSAAINEAGELNDDI